MLRNATEGKEAGFNEWYDKTHLADVLAVPGFGGARRFRAAPEMIAVGDVKWRYLAIYDTETDDLGKTMAALKARAPTGQMPLSDAVDAGTAHAVAYLAMDTL